MISKHTLKEIIVSNEEFILREAGKIVSREGVQFPEKLNKVVIFYGVRRSGKTYILYDLFRKHKGDALYLDFEDERLNDFGIEDFDSLKEAFLDLKPRLNGKELLFLFDEIQNVKGWERFCRRANERGKIKIVVTGSSSKMMPMEIHTSLRGRSWSIEVFPFSFRESLRYSANIDAGDESNMFGSKKYLIKKHFDTYQRWGGFPEVLFLKTSFEKKKILKEYMGAMFFKDLVERFKVSNVQLLELLFESLLSSFSSKFSLTSFYKQYKQKFPFSKDSLFTYYKYFLESLLVFEVRKFSQSSYKRMRNPAKIYPVDVGLCRKVASADAGRILENMAFLELKKKCDDLFYFEDDVECDFILRDFSGDFSAYQVTQELEKGNEEREVKGLIKACKRLSLTKGTIFTYEQEDERKFEGVKINIIPLWKWLLTGNAAGR